MLARAGLLLVLLFSGCNYRVEKVPVTDPTANFDPADAGFEEIRSFVFGRAPGDGGRCVKCHAELMGSYENVVANLAEIQRRVEAADADQMPPANEPQLSPGQRRLLLGWIALGAPQVPGAPPAVAPAPAPSPEPTPTNGFALVSRDVLGVRCIRCHSGWAGSYEGVLERIDDIQFRVTDVGGPFQMPPPNRPQLSEEERDLLLRWIELGAPREGGVEETQKETI